MAWWGKLIGGAFGYLVGGPLGALLGVALGHNLDRGMAGLPDNVRFDLGDRERVQMAFFSATFSVMGAIAKADGQVTQQEIALAEALMAEMDLSRDKREAAIRLFQEGKEPGFPLRSVVEQFRQECHRRQTLLQMFLEIQIQAGYADGQLQAAEEQLLLDICRWLGFSELLFRQLQHRVEAELQFARVGARQPERRAQDLDFAYLVLGIERGASDAEVKTAYRRLTSQHHPDKLVAKGLPEEMMKMAEQKTIEIRAAYEQIKSARGMR
jgi:DnaJ like chaperone protein